MDPNAPSEIAAFEEAMVPPLALVSYLRLAATLFARHPALFLASIASELLALLSMLALVWLAFVASGVSLPQTAPTNAEAITEGVMAGLPSSGMTSFAFLGLAWVAVLVARAGLDTFVARAARSRLARDRRYALPAEKHVGAFLSSHVLGTALSLAVAFFLTPIVGRIVLGSPLAEHGYYFVFAGVSLVIGVFWGHQVRLLMQFIQGWMAWRGQFIAGAFGSGLAAPVKNAKTWILLSATWGLLSSLLLSSITQIFLIRGVSTFETMLTFQSTTVTMMLVAVFWSQLSAWVSLSVLCLVGHQIGDIATETVESRAYNVKSLFRKIDASEGDQTVIPTAPRGFFKVSASDAPPLSFEEVLGKAKVSADMPDDWTFEAENAQVTARSTTAGGGSEVSLTFERPEGLLAGDAPKPKITAPLPIIITGNHQAVEGPGSSLLAPRFMHGATGQRGLQRLGDSLSPSVVRTQAGDPEVRYRGPKS